MSNDKKIEWALRIGVVGEFLGHGMLAVGKKTDWVTWISNILHVSTGAATTVLVIIGLFDIVLAISVLVKPIRRLLIWMALWGLWTALLIPIVERATITSIWDFITRFANFGAPLALYFITKAKEVVLPIQK